MGIPWKRIFGFLGTAAEVLPMGGIVGKVVQAISRGVTMAEVIGGSGADKHNQVRAYVAGTLDIIEEAIERDALDDATVLAAVDALIQAEVSVRNAVAAVEAALADYQARKG